MFAMLTRLCILPRGVESQKDMDAQKWETNSCENNDFENLRPKASIEMDLQDIKNIEANPISI